MSRIRSDRRNTLLKYRLSRRRSPHGQDFHCIYIDWSSGVVVTVNLG